VEGPELAICPAANMNELQNVGSQKEADNDRKWVVAPEGSEGQSFPPQPPKVGHCKRYLPGL
jgi:hypothetical protein